LSSLQTESFSNLFSWERALTSPASQDHAVSHLSLTNYDSLHPEIRVGYKFCYSGFPVKKHAARRT